LAVNECGQLIALQRLGKKMVKSGNKSGLFLYSNDNNTSDRMGCITFIDAVSMTVTERDYFVLLNHKLLCLGRTNLQIRWEKDIQPLTGNTLKITAGSDYRFYMLDTVNKKVLTGFWDWVPGTETEIHLKQKDANNNDIPYILDNPLDIASDRWDNIYILEGTKNNIIKFDSNGNHLSEITIPFKDDANFTTLAVNTDGHIFLGYQIGPQNTLVKNDGILRLVKTSIYHDKGEYITIMLDSTRPKCVWHRVELAARIPANTFIEISYYADDENPNPTEIKAFSNPLINPSDALLVDAGGRYLRMKITLTSNETNTEAPLIEAIKVHFPRDTYLRYLPAIYSEELASGDENSPEYKEAMASRDFMEKFLSLFETLMSGTEQEILRITRYFDALGSPDQFIPWLSSWLAIAYDENWPLDKKRELLMQAPKLYKMRGTRKVLESIIKIYLDIEPIIIEKFQLRCEEENELRDLWNRLLGCGIFGFCVLVPPWKRWKKPVTPENNDCAIIENEDTMPEIRHFDETEVRTLKRIIDTEKPAHTSGGLQVMQPFFYLDMHTYLGINTALTKPQWVTDTSSIIGRDTVMVDKEESAQVERHSRIGLDFKLT
jgi:phage tail-like protein